jgi:beta-ribofuranosylaminobenzene 5'-phosphate synthase
VTAPEELPMVFVEAAARLHFGVLDLRGSLGRWFGGLGAAAPEPTLLLSARLDQSLGVEGEDADRAEKFARAFLAHHDVQAGARISIHRALPPHAGLGSGTQLALAVARAIAELHGLPTAAAALAGAVGRAQRSAVGTWTFDGGGLVVEGGRRDDTDGVGPLIARIAFPPSWRCIVAVPRQPPAISGWAEASALAALARPPEREVERVAHLVLMALLPALADADLAGFGRALTAIQTMTGRWFASVQGGTFARGPSEELVRRMTERGAPGVGQSSWGPAVYGIVGGEAAALELSDAMRAFLGERCEVYHGGFATEGAKVNWRAIPFTGSGTAAG